MSTVFTIEDLFALRYQLSEQTNNENIIINRLKRKLLESGMTESDANNLLYIFYLSYDIPMTLSEIEQVDVTEQIVPIMPLYFSNFINILTNYINTDNTYNTDNINTNTDNINTDTTDNINTNTDNNTDNIDTVDEMPPLLNTDGIMDINIDEILPTNTFGPFEFFINIPPINIPIFTFYTGPPQTVLQDVVVTTDIDSINQMDTLKITSDMNEKCLICMEEMNEDDIYIDIKCKHIYHKECLIEYLTKYNHICPTCRMDIGHPVSNFNSN
jgi:hypothetical protein